MPRRASRTSWARRVVFSAGVVTSLALEADAVNKTWVGSNGLWSTAAAWNPVNQPLAGDVVILQQGAFTCTLDASATVPALGQFNIGNGMTFAHTAGTFNANTIVAIGSTGAGTYNHNGGSMSHESFSVGLLAGTNGTLLVNSGTLSVVEGTTLGASAGASGALVMGPGRFLPASLVVGSPDGGTGTVTANAGTMIVGGGFGQIDVNSNGRFNLSGTSLSVGTVQMNGGSFTAVSPFNYSRINLASGTFTIANATSLSIPSASTFFKTGGTLNSSGASGSILVSGTGVYSQTAGFTNISHINSIGGLVSISGGSFTAGNTQSVFGATVSSGTLDFSGSGSAQFRGMMFGQTVGLFGFANITNGTINTGGLLTIANGGSATWSQTGGVVNTSTFATNIGGSGAGGTMLFSGGASFSTASMSVGGSVQSGFVQQTAGAAVNVTGAITLSPSTGLGTYVISGGTLNAGTIDVQPGGVLAHFSTGTITPSTRIVLNGGSITATSNRGELIYNSGSAGIVTNFGSITLNNSSTFVIDSLINQSTGTIAIGGNRAIGVGSALLNGSVTVSGGDLSSPESITIGQGQTGTFSHLAGTVSADTVTVSSGSPASYSISGGATLTVGSLNVAPTAGAGTFIHSGGQVDVAGRLRLGFGTGRYDLSSGTLNAGSMQIISGSTFNQTGGVSNFAEVVSPVGTLAINGGTMNCGSVLMLGGNTILNGGALITPLLEIDSGTFMPQSGILRADQINLRGGVFAGSPTYPIDTIVNHTAGTLFGNFVNNGTYNYTAGSVTARFTNNNVLNLLGNLVAQDGIANNASFTIAAGRTLTANGQGLDNFGTLVLNGGTIDGAALVVNAPGGVMLARGNIASTGTFINNGLLETTGQLSISSPSTNIGVITIGLAEALTTGGGMSNFGQINLAGGGISGGIVNFPGASLRGHGIVTAAMISNGGVIFADNAQPLTLSALGTNAASGQVRIGDGSSMNLLAQLTNNGVIQLDGPSASLGGAGTIVNVGGTIRGAGRITSATQNGGIVRVENGDLDIAASFLNASSGRVEIPAERRITFTGGMQPNEGLITLGGGTFDHGLLTFTNSLGRVEGRGAIRAGAIVNSASITLSGGVSEIFAPLTQNSPGKTIVTGFGTTTFYGNLTNNASTELRVSTGATAIFLGDVAGLSNITGGGVKVFEGAAAFGRLVTPGSSVIAPGAALAAEGIRESSLEVSGQATIDGSIVSRLNQLTIAGAPDAWTAQLDLTDDRLILDYSGATPLATVANQIKSGFNNGAWDGAGISSSAAAAQPNRALGFAQATDLGSPATIFGEPIDASTILIRFTIPGDANLDAVVDIGDFALLAANFNTSSYWAKGDFNFDGQTELGDFARLAANFNQSLPINLPRGASVPETACAIGVAVVGILARRRRA